MKETIKNLKKVYSYGKEFKKNLIIFSLMSFTFIIINVISPILAAKQILYITGDLYKELLIASGLVLFITVIASINHWILRRNTQVFFRGTTKNIQLDAANEILKIELKDIDKSNSGTFIQRIGSDTDEMSRIFTRGMGYLTSILTDIGIYFAIFIINKEVFVFYVAASIILATIHLKKSNKVNEKDKIYRKRREEASGLIGELVRGVRDIKMLSAKKPFMKNVNDNIDNLTKSTFDMRNTEMNYNLLIETINGIIQFSLIALFVLMLSKSIITVGTAIILYNYKSRVLNNLIDNVGNLLTEVKSFNLSANRVFSLLGNKEFKKEKFGHAHMDIVKGNFEFRNVTFGYNENKVLKNMSFKIKENSTIAFVGKSGVGKTTIFSLLCRLYIVNSGQILIDGKDINDLDEESIRGNITIISQNPYIFNMSIRDNLRLVKTDLTEEEMVNACKMACLDDFIKKLPNGYDTVVGEGGISLSGGQRQRLAIARAFVQNTKIILFDEATSALDNETQKSIQEAINNMKEKYTILIIAHRLSTIINCDKIMIIDDGKVTAVGKHKELLKNNKMYRKLYETETLEK